MLCATIISQKDCLPPLLAVPGSAVAPSFLQVPPVANWKLRRHPNMHNPAGSQVRLCVSIDAHTLPVIHAPAPSSQESVTPLLSVSPVKAGIEGT